MNVKHVIRLCKDKRILLGVAIDSLYVILMYFFVVVLGTKLAQKATALSNQVASGSLVDPATVSGAFAADAQSFAILFLIGIILLVVLLFFGGGLSRELLWSLFHKTRFNFKKGFKWGFLLFLLLVGVLPFALLLIFIFGLLQALLQGLGAQASSIISALIISFGIAFILLTLLTINAMYAKHGKVLRSIMYGFENISKSWKKTFWVVLYSFLGIVLINLLFFPFNYYYGYVTWATAVNTFSFLLLVAWVRVFVVRELA